MLLGSGWGMGDPEAARRSLAAAGDAETRPGAEAETPLPLLGCVTLGKPLGLSEPQFPQL